MIKKSEIGELPKFFDRYISITDDLDLIEGLHHYAPHNVFPSIEALAAIKDKIYAPGKWTIKDILQHCIDTERIMAYRALCFARFDENMMPGFDEGDYAKNTNLENRTVADLIEEFGIVRKSNIMMFEGFNKKMLLRKGTANHIRLSPLSLCFVIMGHGLHHANVIKERYLNLK
jgi:hypothetical protein